MLGASRAVLITYQRPMAFSSARLGGLLTERPLRPCNAFKSARSVRTLAVKVRAGQQSKVSLTLLLLVAQWICNTICHVLLIFPGWYPSGCVLKVDFVAGAKSVLLAALVAGTATFAAPTELVPFARADESVFERRRAELQQRRELLNKAYGTVFRMMALQCLCCNVYLGIYRQVQLALNPMAQGQAKSAAGASVLWRGEAQPMTLLVAPRVLP